MNDDTSYDRDATGDTAACRHCGCTIERIAAGWVDEAGFFACVKAPLESVGSGKPAGFVQHEPMPEGLRGAPEPACSDCGDTLTVASVEDRRYCRVDAGRRMAAGESVSYDQDPADGEPPRLETDCRGSGIYDCPCEADGPDGVCSCCRSGECNGSCRLVP
jgi:hypothetical protein